MERIQYAAIRWDGTTWSVPQPGRHHDVLKLIALCQPGVEHIGGEQGFVTTKGRFVDREEARQIAVAAGQLIASCRGPDGVPYTREHRELFSEDVW